MSLSRRPTNELVPLQHDSHHKVTSPAPRDPHHQNHRVGKGNWT
jgi:hypothetical protein